MTLDAGTLVVGLAAAGALVAAFHFADILGRARAATKLARRTMAAVTTHTLHDEEKERLVQRAALDLFAQFGLIALSTILVLAAPGLVMWGGQLIGVTTFHAVLNLLSSWEFATGITVLILLAVWLERHS